MSRYPMINRALAFASGLDAGNRHMDPHTIKAWDIDAWNVAAETTNRPDADRAAKGEVGAEEAMSEDWPFVGLAPLRRVD